MIGIYKITNVFLAIKSVKRMTKCFYFIPRTFVGRLFSRLFSLKIPTFSSACHLAYLPVSQPVNLPTLY